MTDQQRSDLKVKVQATIVEMQEKIRLLEEDTQPIAPENSIGRVSRMDAINNKSVAEATLRTARRKLSSLRVALSKVDQDDFGRCANCGKDIQPMRLMYLPESSNCVLCAR